METRGSEAQVRVPLVARTPLARDEAPPAAPGEIPLPAGDEAVPPAGPEAATSATGEPVPPVADESTPLATGKAAARAHPRPATPSARPAARDESAEFLELVHSLLHAVRRDATTRLEPVGTTPGQLRLLRALQHSDGPRRLGELAQVLDVAPRSITAKVDQAEADGQVRRIPDPDDRRATLVELTADGLAVLARVSAERSVGAGERLARLAPDERAELLRLLRVVATPPA